MTHLFFINLDLDLVPWRCSCRGTQRQLGYGSFPGVSVLGKMNRVVYSQAHVSTVAPDYIKL